LRARTGIVAPRRAGSSHRRIVEFLSALIDGELDDSAVAAACAAWRDDPGTRAQWHAFHLIGDVLRSEDLASTSAGDDAFMAKLRSRLAAEPVVLAPGAPAAVSPRFEQPARRVVGQGRSGRWGWMAPAAVAAGFVAVAGVLVVTQGPSATGVNLANGGSVATNPAPLTQSVAAPSPLAAAEADALGSAPALVANRQMLRDARLDQYLAAHKQFAGSSALGVPSAFLRSATAEVPSR